MQSCLIQTFPKNKCSPVAYKLVIKWMQSCLIQSCHNMNAVMSHTILSSKWMQSCLMLVYATTSVLFYRLSLCNITLGKKKYCKGNVCSKIYGIVFSKVWSIQNHTRTLPKSHSDFTKIILRLYQNHTPTLPKSHSDFHITTGWLSQHHKLIFTKSHSDFTKITLRLYQNRRLIFTKSLTDFHKTRVDFEAPDCCFTVRLFKTAPSPILRPACKKASAVSSRACRVALTVFVLIVQKKRLVLFTGSSCSALGYLY